jgi:DNA-binding response OmpR family regulator
MLDQNNEEGSAFPNNGLGVDLDGLTKKNRKNVLIVEDEPDTVFLLKQIFLKAGFNVSSSLSGTEGLHKVNEINPDLILLDLMMPDMDGWEAYDRLRKITDVPVIIVSAIGRKDEIVRALRMGVEDYVTKPFFNEELVERSHAVLRRVMTHNYKRLYFPNIELEISMESQEVKYHGQSIQLTGKEFAVLCTLAKRAPQLVNYETIKLEVWGEDNPKIQQRIKYLVFLLRQKFESITPTNSLISTVGRLGYKLLTE